MITIKLNDGRELALDPAAPHEAMGIAEGCRQLSGIRQWWRMAMTVASIRYIDGIPLPLPAHEKHIEGMIARFSKQDLRMISVALENQYDEQPSPELELVELKPIEILRIWALIGEFEAIAGWVAPAFIAASVRKIGDEKISLPSTKEEMRALVARLGLAGMSKASALLSALTTAEKAAEADKQAAAKN
jgi:hypothetical protein